MSEPNEKFLFFFVYRYVPRFSINFTLDECPDPPNVAYHFETRFNNNTVAHNFKTNGNWNSEIVNENTWIEGTGTHCGIYASIT